jgi:hypothetical protein
VLRASHIALRTQRALICCDSKYNIGIGEEILLIPAPAVFTEDDLLGLFLGSIYCDCSVKFKTRVQTRQYTNKISQACLAVITVLKAG